MSWHHVTAPDTVFRDHLRRDHRKDLSWIEEHSEDLRTIHKAEHEAGHVDHRLDEGLRRY